MRFSNATTACNSTLAHVLASPWSHEGPPITSFRWALNLDSYRYLSTALHLKASLNTLCTIAFLVTKAVRSGGRRVTLTCSLEVRLALSRRPQEAILETRGNVTTGCDVACAQTYNGGDLIAVFDTPFFVKNVRCSRPNPAPRLMILIGDIVIVLLIWICVLVAVLQGSVQKARRSQPRENIHFRLSADL